MKADDESRYLSFSKLETTHTDTFPRRMPIILAANKAIEKKRVKNTGIHENQRNGTLRKKGSY
jgi:hypothetical protein